MSDSVRPHRRQPTRLPCPWDSPGKNTGVGCHFLLQCIKVKSESEVARSCRLFEARWTAAHPAPPSMGFSRQEYWSGLPLPSPGLVAESCPNLTTPGTVTCQAPLFIGFSRQEYWSRLPFPSPGDLPNLRIEPSSPLHCRQILYPVSFTAPFSSLLTPSLLYPHHLRLALASGEPDLRLVLLPPRFSALRNKLCLL